MRRKKRTREHVIHDLAINYVERAVLLRGYSAERITHDYGVDLLAYTYTPDGECESEPFNIQVKATARPDLRENDQIVAVDVEAAHLDAWRSELTPCILVLYDATMDRAWWTQLQDRVPRSVQGETGSRRRLVTLHMDTNKVWNADAVREIAARKNRRYAELWRLLDR